jgi:GNAT superfamily N-acetyltransferase
MRSRCSRARPRWPAAVGSTSLLVPAAHCPRGTATSCQLSAWRLHRAFTLAGDLRAVDASTFRPSATADRAELIPGDDPAGQQLRTRFDGAIFGIRGPHGRLISWAALKLKSESVWEIAVATEAEYRGRGYARDVVSAATRDAIEHRRVAIYIHDRDNTTSAYVARALGYQLYSEIVFAEY